MEGNPGLSLYIVASALIGANGPEQVEENGAASGIMLSADVLEKIEEMLAG